MSALKRLGPFKYRLCSEADLGIPEKGQRFVISQQLAGERVIMLSRQFNERALLDLNAPRPGLVVANLTRIETLAGKLSRHLASLDDISRHVLQTAGSRINLFSSIVEIPFMKQADAGGLPHVLSENEPDEPAPWVNRLQALSQYANWSLNMFLKREGIESIDAVDKGGNRNLYKSLYGSARWWLVHEGWHLYDLCRPDEATGTEGGPFHLFLMDVFEFATGEEQEKHSKLAQWLKSVVKYNRRNKEIIRRELELDSEMDELLRGRNQDITADAKQNRLTEIASELKELAIESHKLFGKLHPYSYPSG